MGLTLVLGPANSAKAGEISAAFARGGAMLVVPTIRDAEVYAREQQAVFGAVFTFGGLIAEIGRRFGLGQRVIGPVARRRVLRRIAGRSGLPASDTPGFADAVGDLVAELAREMISPQRFAQALTAWGGARHELGGLPLAYAHELERLDVNDREGAARLTLDALRADPRRWGDAAVLFYGFDDLTVLERDAVESLARVADVRVSLNYESGREALAARAEVVESLRPLAERVIELPPLDEHYAPSSRRSLHHLERSLFRAGAERIDPGGAVRVLEAGGERAEAELIAAAVRSRLDDGVAPEEMVVVAREPRAVSALYGRVFAAYGVSLSGPVRSLLSHTWLGRSLIGLARCAWAPNATADDLIAYLRTPGLLGDPERTDALEARLRRHARTDLPTARAWSGLDLAPLDALIRTEDAAGALWREARRILTLPHRGEAAIVEAVDGQGLAVLAAAIAELDELFGATTREELLELLEELEIDTEGREEGAVLLSDPLSIRARRFRDVYVCGLQEGTFPGLSAPEPLLSPEMRFEIAQVSGLRLRDDGNELARERYLFYACLSRATERVTLSYRSSDEEGNLALSSPFLADVADLFDASLMARRGRRLLADVVWPAGLAPSPREVARALVREEGTPAPERRLGPAALARVRHTRIVSPGALEGYAACPMRWLVERQLSPSSLEPEAEPLARGRHVHEILQALFLRLGGPVTRERLPEARSVLAELMAELPSGLLSGESDGIREALRLRIEAELGRLLEYEASSGLGWAPARLEQDFGFDAEGSVGPLRLGEGDDEVWVRGKIDRIDVSPDGRQAIVRDYKSGAAKPQQPGARWGPESVLQAPLYMLVVRELLGLDPVAGLYQPLAGRDLRPRGIYREDSELRGILFTYDARSPEALDQELTDAGERAIELARRLRAGELEPCPSTCSREGCRYPSICRV